MPRAPRHEQPNAWYHVTARGVERRSIFLDAIDRRFFLTVLEDVRDAQGWSCLSYCLMGNHYHLLIRTPDPTLAVGMQRLNGRYAQRFNWRYGRSGHLLERRYRAELITRPAHVLESFRYIALNPVKSGVARSPAGYAWSAHRALAGLVSSGLVAVREALSLFHPDLLLARRAYRAFVEGALDHEPMAPTRTAESSPRRPSLDELVARHGSHEGARRANREFGYTVRQIAAALGCHYSTVSRWIQKRETAAGRTQRNGPGPGCARP
jgi:putative transposase